MSDTAAESPEHLQFISGVILVSPQPERSVRFYRDVLGLPLTEEQHGDTAPHWGCELGDVHFAVHPIEDYPEDPATGPSPIKLAFMVFDLDRMTAWLGEHGIDLCYPPRSLGDASRMTAVRDPDGNLVELTELGPSWLTHLKQERAGGNDLLAKWSAHIGPGAGEHS